MFNALEFERKQIEADAAKAAKGAVSQPASPAGSPAKRGKGAAGAAGETVWHGTVRAFPNSDTATTRRGEGGRGEGCSTPCMPIAWSTGIFD